MSKWYHIISSAFGGVAGREGYQQHRARSATSRSASVVTRRKPGRGTPIFRALWLDRHCGLRRLHHLLNGFDRRLAVIAVQGQRHMACSRDDTMDPNG